MEYIDADDVKAVCLALMNKKPGTNKVIRYSVGLSRFDRFSSYFYLGPECPGF